MTTLPSEALGEAPGRGRLAGRRVLVVGAGTRPLPGDPDPPMGNGRAISLLAAREGARVACADRDEAAAADTAGRVIAEGGLAEVLVADVSEAGQCTRLVAETLEGLGGLDGLVLNVGIGAGARLQGTTPETWDEVFAVNLRAHFLVCREALPRMDEGGAIVFISSVAGLTPGSMLPAYDASKAGLLGLCRHVALEGSRRGIRANVVAPGLMDTPIGRAASAGRPSRDRTPVPLGRQGTAWEVAYPTVFLLSGEAGYITGQLLVSDGGLTALR
ncbi:MAG TPA: SDR family NAD(P)-dependent oxidoreductase [Acidimicrobiales bacterium]|nr:SDR family NAD(P)-dependent oxidoreductase [Acidimicrobiales bacterium]